MDSQTLFSANIKEALLQGTFSDLTLVCGSEDFKVHKLILWAKSPVFKKMLGGKFQEANATTIPLPDEDPSVLRTVINFIYTNAFDESLRKEQHSLLTYCVHVYAAADRWDLAVLRNLTVSKFKYHCRPTPGNIGEFVAAIHAVNDNTSDRSLWNIVLPVCKSNIMFLLAQPEFQTLIRELPQLNLELLAMLDSNSNVAGGQGLGFKVSPTPQDGASSRTTTHSGDLDHAEDDGDDEDMDEDGRTVGFGSEGLLGSSWGYRGTSGGGRRLGDA